VHLQCIGEHGRQRADLGLSTLTLEHRGQLCDDALDDATEGDGLGASPWGLMLERRR
jgi:hypothetical protein